MESILSHVAPTKEEAAEWIVSYLAKKHETSFLVSARASGFPLIQRLEAVTAAAMAADANLTCTQQRIISKHLRYTFRSRVIIPEYKQYKLGENQKHPTATCGCFQFQPHPKKVPEPCHFWHPDGGEVLLSEVNLYVESLRGDYTNLGPYANMEGISGWTILGRGDHGKGAWRSHLKIYICSPREMRDNTFADKNDHRNPPYLIRHIGHVVCKKDDPIVIMSTVSVALDA